MFLKALDDVWSVSIHKGNPLLQNDKYQHVAGIWLVILFGLES